MLSFTIMMQGEQLIAVLPTGTGKSLVSYCPERCRTSESPFSSCL